MTVYMDSVLKGRVSWLFSGWQGKPGNLALEQSGSIQK